MRMRAATIALAFAAVFFAAPSAFGQARVLTAPEQAQDQHQDQGKDQAKDQAQDQPKIQPPAAEAPAPQESRSPAEVAPGAAQKPSDGHKQAPGQAQRADGGQPPANERYSFNRVTGGLLRLDRRSGEVALCRSISSGWVCDAVAEERAALEKEIEQLRAEITSLQKQIASLREPSSPPVPPQTVPPQAKPGKSGEMSGEKTGEPPIKLPTAEDIARARAFIAETWHRLVEMIEHWQNQVLRKS